MATTNTQSFAGEVKVTSNLTVDTNTLHVDSITGRVGMGKTDPGYVMDVNGTVNATALYVGGSEFAGDVWTESGSDIYYTGGNVGIGTTDPQKKLHVAGPMRVGNSVDFDTVDGTWGYQTKITVPDPNINDQLGKSVSISGNGSYALVGAYMDDGPAGGPQQDAGAAYIYVRSGSTWSFQQRIEAPDLAADDHLGFSVSISSDGSYALVGSRYDDDTFPDSGSAYIFNRSGSTWSYQDKIVAPDAGQSDYFGWSVSISGNGSYALVGSRYDDAGNPTEPGAGSAYIYVRSGSTWSYQAKITHPVATSQDFFGNSVSISGDGSYALVGAYQDDGSGVLRPGSGSAQIYVRNVDSTWTHQAEILAPTQRNGDQFGYAVSISGDGSYALIGAFSQSDIVTDSGAAYIYVRSGSTWSFQQKITAPDAGPGPGDRFGNSVSISSDGSRALIGARDESSTPTSLYGGAAYIFNRSGSTWSYQDKIVAPDPAQADYFGWSVSISSDGSYAIAGSPQDDDTYGASGSAYIYKLPKNLTVSTPIEADGTLLSFTGQHICFPEGPMEQGLIVSANKNKYVSLNGHLQTDVLAIRSNEALPVVSLSNVANDRTVFGVVDHFEQSGTTRTQENGVTITRQNKELGDNRVVVNSLGEGAIWVANTNGNVASGDLLTTSHLPGYAQKQDDNIFRNRTVAKSTMDCNFGSEQIPARIVLKDEDGNNILDSYGRIQWVDDPERTVSKYKIRYLDVSGTPTDEANAVHRAAFVGCTYHCG